MSVKGGPDKITDGLIISLDVVNNKSYRIDNNLIDISPWAVGQSGGISQTGQYSSNNRRVLGIDPWGNESIVWESYSIDESTNGGGIYVSPQTIDNTKMYRMSWWEKRVENSTSTICRYYAGCHGYGSINGVIGRVGGVGPNTNPYFWNSNLPTTDSLPEGEWCLVVGHVWPSGSGDGELHIDSGIFKINGRIGNISNDYVMIPETTTLRSRTLSVYSPNSDGIIHHTAYPRMDICDGTEPTINDLLNNNIYKWVSLYNKSMVDIIGSSLQNDKYITFRGNGNSIDFIKGDRIDGFDGISDSSLYSNGMTISWWQRIKVDSEPNQSIFCGDGNIGLINLNTESANFISMSAVTDSYSFGTGIIPGGSLMGRWVKFDIVFDFTSSQRSVRWYHNSDLFHEHSNFDSSDAGAFEHFRFTSFGSSISSISGENFNSFEGDLSKLDIYGKPLTDKEIKQHFNAFRSRYGI